LASNCLQDLKTKNTSSCRTGSISESSSASLRRGPGIRQLRGPSRRVVLQPAALWDFQMETDGP
jgi:hypothetical protein